jgi:putative addiction module component (TIGR02574 family)
MGIQWCRYPLDGTISPEAIMDLYTETIRNLPLGERLKLVQTIWDDIVSRDEPIPLPASAVEEAKRRRDEMVKDPAVGLTHDEVWKKIKDERG